MDNLVDPLVHHVIFFPQRRGPNIRTVWLSKVPWSMRSGAGFQSRSFWHQLYCFHVATIFSKIQWELWDGRREIHSNGRKSQPPVASAHNMLTWSAIQAFCSIFYKTQDCTPPSSTCLQSRNEQGGIFHFPEPFLMSNTPNTDSVLPSHTLYCNLIYSPNMETNEQKARTTLPSFWFCESNPNMGEDFSRYFLT